MGHFKFKQNLRSPRQSWLAGTRGASSCSLVFRVKAKSLVTNASERWKCFIWDFLNGILNSKQHEEQDMQGLVCFFRLLFAINKASPSGVCFVHLYFLYFPSIVVYQVMVNWWFGLVVWIPRIRLWEGLLPWGTPRIPNHQPKAPIYSTLVECRISAINRVPPCMFHGNGAAYYRCHVHAMYCVQITAVES